MNKPFEYVKRDDGMVSAIADGREVTLREAVSMTAMSLYEKLSLASAEENADEKKRLEEKIIFQSRVLDSLSNAYLAAIHCC